jgi:iron complex outermembrane receptor protein
LSSRYASQLWHSFLITACGTFNLITGVTTYKQSKNNYWFPEKFFDTDLLSHGKFNTWRIKHDTIFGVRAQNIQYTGRWRYTSANFSSYTITDPENPNWGQPQGDLVYGSYRHYKEYQFNYYMNDVMSLTDKLKLVAGITHARYGRHQDSGNSKSSVTYHYDIIQDADTWRAGLLYEVWPGVTPYFSYSTTFRPQWRNETDDGEIQTFDPLTGKQYEWGVKVDIPDRATITASVYQLTLNNVLSSDPDPVRASLGYEVQGGSQRSRGFEVDATFKLAPGWDALASYAHTEWEYVKSASFVHGSNILNSPKHSFRLWSVYEFQPGSLLEGFGLGAGVTARSRTELNYQRYSAPYATGTLPGYGIVDGVLYYKLKGTKLGIFKDSKFSINFDNLLDKKYWAAGSYSALYAGEPFKATFRWEQTF